jgi:hypothetical protein
VDLQADEFSQSYPPMTALAAGGLEIKSAAGKFR